MREGDGIEAGYNQRGESSLLVYTKLNRSAEEFTFCMFCKFAGEAWTRIRAHSYEMTGVSARNAHGNYGVRTISDVHMRDRAV